MVDVNELKNLLCQQQDHLEYFFSSVDLEAVFLQVQQLSSLKGRIFWAAIGKSASIANKLADTFSSLSIPSFFLNPVEALHGDLGRLSDEDCVIYLSKSGETEELLQLAPILSSRGIWQIAWVCRKQSSLEKLCDGVLHLPFQRELCPFDLVPTTSAAVQLLMGDLVSVALMKEKNLSLDAYSKNHPAGSIGRKVRFVEEVMLSSERLPIVHEEKLLVDALVTLAEYRCGVLLVVNDHQEMVGIYTTGDLNRALIREGARLLEQPLKEMMITQFVSLKRGMRLMEAIEIMQHGTEKRIAMAPVLEGKRIEGLLLLQDMIEVGMRR